MNLGGRRQAEHLSGPDRARLATLEAYGDPPRAQTERGPPDLGLRKVTFPPSKISKLALPALNRLCAICNMTSAPLCQATDGITNER